jgi:hypothetical protein
MMIDTTGDWIRQVEIDRIARAMTEFSEMATAEFGTELGINEVGMAVVVVSAVRMTAVGTNEIRRLNIAATEISRNNVVINATRLAAIAHIRGAQGKARAHMYRLPEKRMKLDW